jgi:hypothetical protein
VVNHYNLILLSGNKYFVEEWQIIETEYCIFGEGNEMLS